MISREKLRIFSFRLKIHFYLTESLVDLSRNLSIAALGRRVKLRKDWEQIKVSWMYKVLYFKFENRPELLAKTEDANLVENSPFDKFWGCGKSKNGKNASGKLLMLVRDHLIHKTEIDYHIKFQEDLSFCCRDISKIKLTFCNH